MNAIEKLQRVFVRDEAYLLLKNWIVEGKLTPGQKLRDKDLADQLGVSRTPIREALLKLEDEGFVLSKPNSSTMVTPIDFDRSNQLYTIVWTLELLAMKQAYEHFTSQHIHKMTDANNRLLKAIKEMNAVEAVNADYDFHFVYILLSGNEELQHILTNLKYKLKRVELYYFEKVNNLMSYEEHLLIIKALEKKNLTDALKQIEYNWTASISRLQPKT